MNYFRFAEFMIDPAMRAENAMVPLHVVEKILRYHLPILNPIRHELGAPLYISRHSGYRTVEWEKARERNGSSEHTFGGLGAVDLRCDEARMPKLLHQLLGSDYPRVAWYPHAGFFHCDFKDASLGRRFWEVNPQGAWKQMQGVRR